MFHTYFYNIFITQNLSVHSKIISVYTLENTALDQTCKNLSLSKVRRFEHYYGSFLYLVWDIFQI